MKILELEGENAAKLTVARERASVSVTIHELADLPSLSRVQVRWERGQHSASRTTQVLTNPFTPTEHGRRREAIGILLDSVIAELRRMP